MEDVRKILNDIEETKNIRVLYACETGSRAWGFPSPDSDYDVRFIYMHERDWYLSLSDRKDTTEYMDGDWDITGWDLKKCLQLLKKSNAPLIERFQSPIEYFSVNGFKEEFKELIRTYYSPTGVFFHHYKLAENFREEMKEKKEVRLKSLFYLIRSLLSCNWVIKNKSVLPMDMEGLMILIDDKLRDELRNLVQLKAAVGEKYLHPMDKDFNNRLEEYWQMIESSKTNLGVNNTDLKPADKFFLKMLNQYAND
ncbi:MAG: nucleotidyltransferase domain-containing protein [Chitinophagaceae bacterium]|nr:nucleotidyltransferase domain-containing protein [Chitinophagaceae bacterium]